MHFIFVIEVLLTFPLCIYCGYKLKANWDTQFILKRKRWLIALEYIQFTWHAFVEFPYFIATFFTKTQMTLYSFFGFVFTISLLFRCITASVFVLRIYILYYSHHYAKVLASSKWQILIDPSIEHSNWFLINKKKKWGNPIYVIKWIILPICTIYFCVFCVVMFTVSTHKHNQLEHDLFAVVFTGGFCAGSVMVGVYYWRQYPKILDEWFIRKEIGLEVKIFIFFPLVMTVNTILQILGIIDEKVSLIIMFIAIELIITTIFYILCHIHL